MKKKVVIIGAGTGGLASSILLAKKGYEVTVMEKNDTYGGRGRVFEQDGFTFDMGPSWYLMPDIFESFFDLIGENINEYIKLERLSPSYKIWFEGDDNPIEIPSELVKDMELFESFEPGVKPKMNKYLKEAKEKYEIAKDSFLYKPYNNIFDFINYKSIVLGAKYSVFSSFDRHLSKYVKNSYLKKVLQYPLVFLGTSPYQAPAVYSLMNHIDFSMGVFYPLGGINKFFKSLYDIALKNGVKFMFNAEVTKIISHEKKVTSVEINNADVIEADLVISNADYEFTENSLLKEKDRQFSKKYWDSRIVAPSGFILYLGIKKKYKSLAHHNLFFSDKWKEGFDDIFSRKALPDSPSYYVCAPSVTDATVAPEGCENIFVLVPVSAGINPTEEEIDLFKEKIINDISSTMGLDELQENIVYERVYTPQDFKNDYNAFLGTALGLAQNLGQTALFRPKTKSSKLENLYYVGANTNPGIGVPMCLISSEIVFKRIEGIKDKSALKKLI